MSARDTNQPSFVRGEMLPQKTPPLTQMGAIRWLRENLFSGWLNTSLTLIALYVIWSFISHIGPWFWFMVWDAGSLSECREILDGRKAACFGVINDRWGAAFVRVLPQ